MKHFNPEIEYAVSNDQAVQGRKMWFLAHGAMNRKDLLMRARNRARQKKKIAILLMMV